MNKIMTTDHNNFIIIKDKIRKAQYEAMKSVNITLISLYWRIGKEIYNKQ